MTTGGEAAAAVKFVLRGRGELKVNLDIVARRSARSKGHIATDRATSKDFDFVSLGSQVEAQSFEKGG